MAPGEMSVFCAICGSSIELIESGLLDDYNLDIMTEDQTEDQTEDRIRGLNHR